MTDKELLEYAAKAAGMPVFASGATGLRVASDGSASGYIWDPLTDDGDVSSMEAALAIDLMWLSNQINASASPNRTWEDGDMYSATEEYVDHGGDKQKARRYASVRVAAEIGKTMK